MLVLFETPAGYALFKVKDGGKLSKVDDVAKQFADSSTVSKMVKLQAFEKFKDTTQALDAAANILEASLGKDLKKFLKKNIVEADSKEVLAVADGKLGGLINKKLSIQCISNDIVMEVFRGIRAQLSSLLKDMPEKEYKAMSLGLSHSLCRYKLKFSPDKVDTMIIQAIALLDELDKELNTYSMRVREWYGWHFPEMGKIVQDHQQFAKIVKKVGKFVLLALVEEDSGTRNNIAKSDLSDILSEELEADVKAAAEISMGTEVAEEDITNIQVLCDQVIMLSEYRQSLFEYLRNRMNAIAPNLTVMVGELVGARLIAHAGSLLNLAKHPASTVQILGAEKALFRALKTKSSTPKYGLIYHASLVGQSSSKNKGKISRVLAAKTSLAVRVDALGDAEGVTVGFDIKEQVERRLQQLDGGSVSKPVSTPIKKHIFNEQPASYNQQADVQMTESKKRKADDAETSETPNKKKSKSDKKSKKSE